MTGSIAQVIAVLITALRPMIRLPLQQDRGNTAEADHIQIVNTSLITEADLTHVPGVILVHERCLIVAATGHGAVPGLQNATNPVTPIHVPGPTVPVGSIMDTVIDGRNSTGVIPAVQCLLDVDTWAAETIPSRAVAWEYLD